MSLESVGLVRKLAVRSTWGEAKFSPVCLGVVSGKGKFVVIIVDCSVKFPKIASQLPVVMVAWRDEAIPIFDSIFGS